MKKKRDSQSVAEKNNEIIKNTSLMKRTEREGYKNKEMKQLRNKMVVDLVLTLAVITLHINVLNQHYPIQLSEVIEIFYVYALWYSSPQF